MNKAKFIKKAFLTIFLLLFLAPQSSAWHDETHAAISKSAGYKKWFNSAGADMIKLKAGEIEYFNHFVNNPQGTVITEKTVFEMVKRYNKILDKGHLYGAIIASLRDYFKDKEKGKYGEYHLAFCAHYIGDLSQPLHNTLFDEFNAKCHIIVDNTVNDEVLENISNIKIYPISVESEHDLAKEIARIANISIKKGYRLEKENRLLTKDEAYEQISHSASLFKAVLRYVEKHVGQK
jgi:hypothetical protein